MDVATNNKTVMGADCRIKGQLELPNDAVIMGKFSGQICVTGQLQCTQSAQIEGVVLAGAISLAGHIKGDVVCLDVLELFPTAHVSGRVFAPRIIVADGAVLDAEAFIGNRSLDLAQRALGDPVRLFTDMVEGNTEITQAASTPAASAATVSPASDVTQSLSATSTQDRATPADPTLAEAAEAAKTSISPSDTYDKPVSPVTVPSSLSHILKRRRAVLGALQSPSSINDDGR